MPRMTQAEVNAHIAKHSKQPQSNGGCSDESELHAQIFDECRRRGWIALHGSMAERTHRTAGEPDFVCLGQRDLSKDPAYAGKVESPWMVPAVYFVEAKTRIGKLSTAQQAMIAHAAKLGHTIHVVRSFEEFIKIITPC